MLTSCAMNADMIAPTCSCEIEPSWRKVLQDELKQPYITELSAFVAAERNGPVPIYPPPELVFNAFRLTPFEKVRVAVVGQDPYHGPGQAHGLSFSVPRGIAPPPSLMNIFKELQRDLGIRPAGHGCLVSWAQQGVLLLNATLTVRHKEPLSHQGRGWERFTDTALAALAAREEPVIFVLWGKFAQEKAARLHLEGASGQHSILMSTHPSPLSAHRGFLGCGHFSEINGILEASGSPPIDWELPA